MKTKTNCFSFSICFYIRGLYYKPMTIINDDPRVVNKLETLLTDDASVIIYNRHMFIVQVTDCNLCNLQVTQITVSLCNVDAISKNS